MLGPIVQSLHDRAVATFGRSPLLGHADPGMPLRVYAHVVEGAQERAVAGIEEAIAAAGRVVRPVRIDREGTRPWICTATEAGASAIRHKVNSPQTRIK